MIFIGKKGGESALECEQGKIEKLICIPTDLKFDEREGDQVYIDYYKRASAEDSVGFSLSSSVLEKLYFTIKSIQNQEIDSVRIYPGIDESNNKLLIVKPLNEGRETANVGLLLREQIGNPNGPCPKWCNHETRIIKLANAYMENIIE